MSHERILIMAGGTGGHVYPALAIADYLHNHGVSVLWLGTDTGIEAGVVPAKGYALATIRVAGLRGKGRLRALFAPFMLCLAMFQVAVIIRRFKPNAVLGMGGYVSGPGGVAAWLLRVPLYIHEQNAVAGLTNRLLAPLAKMVMQGFPHTFRPGEQVLTTGNPVREEIISLSKSAKAGAVEKREELCLLVLGGSLGARVLNQTIPATLHSLAACSHLRIWHQTGRQHLQQTRQTYTEFGLTNARVDAFIDDMAAAYAWADLVLCRAGALTLAELCVSGLASVLVPYPYAVDDHQTANARYLSDAGAAILLPESELKVDRLAALINGFCHTRTRLQAMAEKARQLACPNATTRVAEICLGGLHV